MVQDFINITGNSINADFVASFVYNIKSEIQMAINVMSTSLQY